ncbi:hypothetical protein [Scytonema sp. PCC 10023]|uniref:hypothetical protein n=1 Tax=Scytonema sp. PCC 10023 TaxID=1680591 RepID=UPI0039C6317D
MFYISLINQHRPPPEEAKNKNISHIKYDEFDRQAQRMAKVKLIEEIQNIQQVYYQERRLFL